MTNDKRQISNAIDESTGIEEVLWVKLMLNLLHHIQGGSRVAPNVDRLFKCSRSLEDGEKSAIGLAAGTDFHQGFGLDVGAF